MTNRNFSKTLDTILLSFVKDYNKPKTLDELNKLVFPEDFEKEYPKETPDKNISHLIEREITNKNYLEYALEFLNQEDLVVYDSKTNAGQITSKGFLKIETQGFEDKIKYDKNILELQNTTLKVAKISLFVSIISVIVTAYFSNKTNESVFYNTNSKTPSNCIEKTCKPTNDVQFQQESSSQKESPKTKR